MNIRSLRMEAARLKSVHKQEEWSALLDACGYRCVKCGSAENIQKDHIKPIHLEGDDGLENLQPLCGGCNIRKGPESLDYRPSCWRQLLAQRLAHVRATEVVPPRAKEEPPLTEGQLLAWEVQKAKAKAFLATIGTRGGQSTSDKKRASSASNAAKATKARLAKKTPSSDGQL